MKSSKVFCFWSQSSGRFTRRCMYVRFYFIQPFFFLPSKQSSKDHTVRSIWKFFSSPRSSSPELILKCFHSYFSCFVLHFLCKPLKTWQHNFSGGYKYSHIFKSQRQTFLLPLPPPQNPYHANISLLLLMEVISLF